MKKLLILTVGLLFLALAALACGGCAPGSGGTAAGAGCPDGWDPVQPSGFYHGVILGIASDRGGFSAVNTVKGASISNGFGIPGSKLSMYTTDGWVMATWDGESGYLCAKWDPDHVDPVVVTPGPSTGDAYIMDGDGCPDSYTFVSSGGTYGSCVFEPDEHVLKVYCNGEFNRDIMRYESGPVWRSDSEPSAAGLQVFWPGSSGFACVKER